MLVLNKFTHDTRVYKEAYSLARAGHNVTVWALGDGQLPAQEEMGGFLVRRRKLRSAHYSWRLSGMMLAEQIWALTAALARERADVYHAHDANALLQAYLAARLTGAALVYDAHELWSECWVGISKSDRLYRLFVAIERLLIRRANAVITVNSSIAAFLAKRYRIPPPLVLMNSQEYQQIESSDILRCELGIPTDRPVAIHVGVLALGRGLDKLIEAALYVDRAVIVLMGPDRLNGQLQHLVTDRALQNRVIIRKPVPPNDVVRYIASADLGVIPTQSINLSYHYSLENKLFQCLMAGIPIAVSDQPEKRRIVETYDVGVVFDETDPRSIAQAINDLLNDRERYEQMCRNARRATREELNWGVEERKLLDLYRSLELAG